MFGLYFRKVMLFFWTKQPVLLVLILGFTHLSLLFWSVIEKKQNKKWFFGADIDIFSQKTLIMTGQYTLFFFFAMMPWLSFSFGPPRGKVWVPLESVSSQNEDCGVFLLLHLHFYLLCKDKGETITHRHHSAYRHVSIIVGQTWKKWETTKQISPKIHVGDGGMTVKFKSRTF